jgi:hypothetical protein
MRILIGEQIERTPKATNSAIVMEATKDLMDELLIDPKGALVRKFDLEELAPVLDKCKYMNLLSIRRNRVQVYTEIWGHGWHRHAQRL